MLLSKTDLAGSRRKFLLELAGLTLGTAALNNPLRAAEHKEIELARDGRSKYRIVLSRNASPSERRAADELQKFIEEMSGARLPIAPEAASRGGKRIFLGQSEALDSLKPGIDFDALGPEGFALKALGRNLVIAGGEERGTMYGVSTFLEKLGCRWFTRDVSRIPRKTTITVPVLDEVHQPAFEYRLPFAAEAQDKNWAARNKVNGGLASPLDASTGGSVQYYPFVHSFFALIPPKKYYADHPEYFSLIDGARRTEQAQLCLTNSDVLRVVTKTVMGWIVEHPEAQIISVSQNDWSGWCECDNCRQVMAEEGAVSGLLLRFVNAVAEQVEARYPGKLIDTLAYQMTEQPPLKVRPRPNVRVRLCPIGACEAHPYETCPHNAYFVRNLKGWAAISRHLYVWHYTTNFTHYILPFPDFDELAADTGMYHRNGVVGVFFQGDEEPGGGADHADLRSYLTARLLWDPATDVDREVMEFHKACYGAAAPPMLEYYKLLQRMVRPSPRGEGQHIFIRRSPTFSAANLQEARRLLREAENLAGDEAIRGRVQKARLTVDYAELLASKRFSVDQGQYAPVDLPGVTERFHGFMAEAQRMVIQHLHAAQSNEADEQQFAAFMKPYALAQLENAALRVDVAPQLTGRVVGLIEKSSGKNAVRHAEPEELWSESEIWNPNFGGLGLFPHADFHERRPMEVKWTLDAGSTNNRTCRLTGEAAGGLRFERTLELEGDGPQLRTRTVAVNGGTQPITLTLESSLDANPADRNAPLEIDVLFRARSGSEVARHISSLTQEYLGTARFQGDELPAGEWRVKHSPLGLVLMTSFGPEQVDRCTAQWRARGENRVTLGVWSTKRTLGPGDRLELAVAYQVQQD
ncbi:MAG: DUF4838 domain-containing protein [Terriglobia bacterium]|jgi:hypothetical protein